MAKLIGSEWVVLIAAAATAISGFLAAVTKPEEAGTDSKSGKPQSQTAKGA